MTASDLGAPRVLSRREKLRRNLAWLTVEAAAVSMFVLVVIRAGR